MRKGSVLFGMAHCTAKSCVRGRRSAVRWQGSGGGGGRVARCGRSPTVRHEQAVADPSHWVVQGRARATGPGCRRGLTARTSELCQVVGAALQVQGGVLLLPTPLLLAGCCHELAPWPTSFDRRKKDDTGVGAERAVVPGRVPEVECLLAGLDRRSEVLGPCDGDLGDVAQLF